MGFADSLKAFTGSVSGKFAALSSKDEAFALLAIMAKIALADGELEKEEKDAGIKIVKSYDIFQAHDPSTLAVTLNEYYGYAADPITEMKLDKVIGKLAGKPSARGVVQTGITIAKADGDFEPDEKEKLKEVCHLLKLDPNSFSVLK